MVLVTGVWVGGEDRPTHFKSSTYGQGNVMALPIWGVYMKSCYENKDLGISKEAFQKPKDLSTLVDCSKVTHHTIQDNFDDDLERF